MKQSMLYTVILLFGLTIVVGLGISAFLLGERLLSQKVAPIQSPEVELTGPKAPELKLIVEKTRVQQFDCSAELHVQPNQSTPILKVIAVNEPPDPELHLVSLSGCPLTDSCGRQAGTAVKQSF